MPPHPIRDVDMERKEELILAKQLRAARPPQTPADGPATVRRKDKPAPPPPTPKPNPKSIARAQNPVALRYWNQCLNLAQQSEVSPLPDSQSVIAGAKDEGIYPWDQPNVPWSDPTRAEGKKGNKFKIKVPNINNQIKSNENARTDWASILAEDEAHQNKLRAGRASRDGWARGPTDDSNHHPPKYAWMKSQGSRNTQQLRDMSGERQNLTPGSSDSRKVGGKPTERQNNQDMRTIFSLLPREAQMDLITPHLSSLHSDLLSKYLENIPEELLIQSLVVLLPTFSPSSVSSIWECMQRNTNSSELDSAEFCRFCGKNTGVKEPSLTRDKECETNEELGPTSGEENKIRNPSDPSEDPEYNFIKERTLESQISETLSDLDSEKIEEIGEKILKDDNLCMNEGSIDDENQNTNTLDFRDDHEINSLKKDDLNIVTEDILQSGESSEEIGIDEAPGENNIEEDSGEVKEEIEKIEEEISEKNKNEDSISKEEEKDQEIVSEENNEEDDSWEYEWEDEDDNEYEFFEVDEDEYKVQTFDGSFSIAI